MFSIQMSFQRFIGAKFTGKHLRKSHFLNKVAGYRHSDELSGTVSKFVRIAEYLFYRTPLRGCFHHLRDVFIRTLCLNSY